MILVLAEAARNINIAAVRMRKHPNLEYIIVLGAHVEGTRLTKALLERTRRALQYMEENPETKAVLSGGKGDGESITEAQAMCNYLVEHGIDRESMGFNELISYVEAYKEEAEELKKKGCDAYYFPSFEEIESFCLDRCQKGDVLITMGAGNVVNIGENLLNR